MWLGNDQRFELSLWCVIRPFLFKRLEGAAETLSLPKSSTRSASRNGTRRTPPSSVT